MMFRAKFPDDQFFQPAGKKGSVTGVVYADTNDGGTGVTYNVKIDNLPSEGGPFGKRNEAFRSPSSAMPSYYTVQLTTLPKSTTSTRSQYRQTATATQPWPTSTPLSEERSRPAWPTCP